MMSTEKNCYSNGWWALIHELIHKLWRMIYKLAPGFDFTLSAVTTPSFSFGNGDAKTQTFPSQKRKANLCQKDAGGALNPLKRKIDSLPLQEVLDEDAYPARKRMRNSKLADTRYLDQLRDTLARMENILKGMQKTHDGSSSDDVCRGKLNENSGHDEAENQDGICDIDDLSEKVKKLQSEVHEKKRQIGLHTGFDYGECVICMDAPADSVLLDCGHVVSCTKCAGHLTSCPFCGKEIVRNVRIFRA